MGKTTQFDGKSFAVFIFFGSLIVTIWKFPFGYYILYPFTILGTWFHEMGHGIMAILMGGDFLKLEIFANGSGLAYHNYVSYFIPTQYAQALISAAGLMGPPIIGSIFILMSKGLKKSKFILYLLCFAMILSVFIWIRTIIGITVISGLGILFLIFAIQAKPKNSQFLVQFIGLMACIDTYKQIGYLFTGSVNINGQELLSDTGQIANQLGMNYAFWGTLILIFSIILLLSSLYIRNRKPIAVREL